MLEFGLPRGVWRPLWELYVRVGLPLAGGVVSPAWREVGSFLGPSIRGFHERLPLPAAARAVARGGDRGRARPPAERRRRPRRLGAARVTRGRSPAFYALRPGGWRDYVTLLHPPYTLWHLSYVAVGAALAPTMKWSLLGWTALAFLLAMGVGAHALDELHGRPLQTRIPRGVLVAAATVSLAAACGIGIGVALGTTLWLLAFVGFGAFVVVAYNLELLGGAFHSDLWFAAAWGAFPALTAYFAVRAARAGRGGRRGGLRVPRELRAAAALDPGAARAAAGRGGRGPDRSARRRHARRSTRTRSRGRPRWRSRRWPQRSSCSPRRCSLRAWPEPGPLTTMGRCCR